MYELYVCFQMWLGLCGSIHRIPYDTKTECQAELAEIRKNKAVSVAYCLPRPATVE